MLIPKGAKISMLANGRKRNKRNDLTKTNRRPPAGAQTAYCSRNGCTNEVHPKGRGTARVDAAGCAVTEWRCSVHGYIAQPVYAGDAE